MIESLNLSLASKFSSEECISKLKTDAVSGLSSSEANIRLSLLGYNELKTDKRDSPFKKYFEQFKNPLIFLLLSSSIVSILMQQYDDAISITIAVVIVVTVGFVQEYRSEKILEKLNRLVPPVSHCLRNGRLINFFARELVPGDIVILESGDRVPADIRLIEANSLHIDESSFTGENEPSVKHSQPVNDIKLDETKTRQSLDNIAFLSTLVCSGRGKGLVVATGAASRFGEVFKLMESQDPPKSPLQKSMDHLGSMLTVYSLAVIGGIFIIGLIQGRSFLNMFTIGVSLAVAAIPEGLPIVVAVTLALGVIRMGNRNAVVKRLSAVETLGCVTVICADKTGTLTKNEMTASVVVASDGSRSHISGVGYDPESGYCLTETGEQIIGYSHPGISEVIIAGLICNNAQVFNGNLIGQPTEGALMVLSMKARLFELRNEFQRLKEIPFSSDKKWMAVYAEPVKTPGHTKVFLKGAIENVLSMCKYFFITSSIQMDQLDTIAKDRIKQAAHDLGSSGLRVIGMASGDDMDSLCYVGMVGILDPPKPGTKETISVIRSSGVSVKMITGDSLECSTIIGKWLDIYKTGDGILSGEQIDRLSDDDFEKIIRDVSIFCRTSPRHKLRIVKALQDIGEVVAMTGDGVNDAVALKKSDIGIAMGKSGTDVSREAADMVLIDDGLASITKAIEEGKGIYHNIRNFVKFQMSTSVAALSLISISTLFHFENPLNAMQILWINIIMDGPPAQSLAVEPVDPDVMRQPPRNTMELLLNSELITSIISSASIIIMGTLFVFYKEMAVDNKITPRDTTMTFTCFVFFDMWNALSCRSTRKFIWEIGLRRNPMFCLAISGSIFCQLLVIYFAPLQRIFQTEALTFSDITFLALLTSSVFIFNETVKYFKLNPLKLRRISLLKSRLLVSSI